MKRTLSAKSSLDTLRKEAKRWLHDLRANDERAAERLRQSYPSAAHPPTLRDIQQALAREYGVADWVALKSLLADNALAHLTHRQRLADFLEHSCLHYGVPPGPPKWDPRYADHPSRWRFAARVLERYPEVTRDSIHAAAVSGDLVEVRRILAVRPQAATEKGGPHEWPPILYVCYGRLPVAAAGTNAVAIANALLDAGGDAASSFTDGENTCQALTGIIGDGEFAQPSHPDAMTLANLLIERGADACDFQAMYNTSLHVDTVYWLDFLYERSRARQEEHRWNDASSQSPPRGILNYLLSNAVTFNHLQRARWVLERGADAQRTHHYSKRSLHTQARLHGYAEMAELLVEFGAVPEELAGSEAFQAACMRLDRDAALELSTRHPEYLLDAAALLQAAHHDQFEVAKLLLDLGMSPDVRDQTDYRPLHAAASKDSIRVGQLLIERGAEIDAREKRHNGIPLGWALHGRNPRMLELLGRSSRNPQMLTMSGNIERLRELFATHPELLQMRKGSLLFFLPDEEDRALEVAAYLLAQGVDPHIKDEEGLTASQHAEKQGLDTLADLLR